MNKSLNVAIFHLGFFFSGGGERLVIEEARGLIKLGCRVDVYAPIVDRQKCYPDLLKNFTIKALFPSLPFRHPFRDFIAISAAIILTPLTWWRFRRYDIFIGANQPGHAIAYLLTRILHKPYILYLALPARVLYPRKIDQEVGFGKGSYELFFLVSRMLYPLVIKLDQLAIKKAAYILVAGSYISKVIKNLYGVKVINCPAGVHPLAKLPKISRFHGKIILGKHVIPKPYILLTNRHFPQKRFEFIIAAMPYLIARGHDVRLVITGDRTVYTDFLRSLAKQLGVMDKIFFTGLISEKDLLHVYTQAAVYVYTAPEEDFGMGIIESMACGVPVVAWNKGGPATIIQHKKNGLLVRDCDFKSYLSAVEKLLVNQRLNHKLGQAAYQQIKNKYSFFRHNQQIFSILEKAYSLYYADKR